MAATRDALTQLAQAAFALPILALPVKAGAAEVGEVGFNVLSYKERGLMKITEPVLWGRAQFLDSWQVQGSAAVDIISGASPQLVSNATGRPVQTITGASVVDHRNTADAKLIKRFGEFSLAVVDEAIYALAGDNGPDLHSTFWGERGTNWLGGKNWFK